jgi:hypothetical protein
MLGVFSQAFARKKSAPALENGRKRRISAILETGTLPAILQAIVTKTSQTLTQGVSTMFGQTSNISRNVVAMFFAIVFSTVTVAAAVGPAQVSAPAPISAIAAAA